MSIGAYYAEAIPSAFWAGWSWMLGQGIQLTLLLGFVLVLWAIGYAGYRAWRRHHSWADAVTQIGHAVRDFGVAGIAATGLALFVLFGIFFVQDAPRRLNESLEHSNQLQAEINSLTTYRYHNELTVKQIFHTVDSFAFLVGQQPQGLKFSITAPSNNQDFYRDLYDIFVKGCQKDDPRQNCVIEPVSDVDTLPASNFVGITIHQLDKSPDDTFVDMFSRLMPFIVHRSVEMPDAITRMFRNEKRVYWFEIGVPGYPYKDR